MELARKLPLRRDIGVSAEPLKDAARSIARYRAGKEPASANRMSGASSTGRNSRVALSMIVRWPRPAKSCSTMKSQRMVLANAENVQYVYLMSIASARRTMRLSLAYFIPNDASVRT